MFSIQDCHEERSELQPNRKRMIAMTMDPLQRSRMNQMKMMMLIQVKHTSNHLELDKLKIFSSRLHLVESGLPKKTVAETVNSACKYLVNLNGQSSLITLKKYLTSECGETYVARNNDRIKTELKSMFTNNVIYPAHRSKTGSKPSVTVAFKFRSVKQAARRVPMAEKKMAQKKAAKATNKKN